MVAGLNYKLTLALMKNDFCLGAFKVTIYNHFGDLSVTSWGTTMGCDEVKDLINEVMVGEEATALMMEEDVREEREEVEPDN